MKEEDLMRGADDGRKGGEEGETEERRRGDTACRGRGGVEKVLEIDWGGGGGGGG